MEECTSWDSFLDVNSAGVAHPLSINFWTVLDFTQAGEPSSVLITNCTVTLRDCGKLFHTWYETNKAWFTLNGPRVVMFTSVTCSRGLGGPLTIGSPAIGAGPRKA